MKKITIIGAGLGGLSAGALLAKEGYQVTILEQHTVVGGCATTFKRKGGFTCEVGLHEMDGVYTNTTVKKVFEALDVYNNVEFLKPKTFFQITTPKGTFVMPHGVEASKKALKSLWSDQDETIDQYFKLIEAIHNELYLLQNLKWYQYPMVPLLARNVLRYRSKSVSEVMDQLTDNETLKLILNANLQYYNDIPQTLSFLLHAVAQYSYYHGGGYFIKGGSQQLSNYLAKVIVDHGGSVITKALVTKIEDYSVEYRHRKSFEMVPSDIIISNLSPQDTYRLFGTLYQETKEIANSLLTVYIGFNKNLKEVYGEQSYTHFIYDKLSKLDDFSLMAQKEIRQRGFTFVDYSQVDATLTPSDKSFGVVCLSDYIEDWEDLDQEVYKAKKHSLQEAIIRKLETYYPDISKYIEYIETGTAKTVQRYIKTPQGTAYGYKATPKQFFKVPDVRSKKIKNLYFVGQWVIAGGFSPAISSGYLAYKEIMR